MSKNRNLAAAKAAKNDELYTSLSDIENELNQIKVKDLSKNVQRYVHITEHNIATIYDYFCRNVIKNVKKIKSHDLVGIFMGVITNGDEYYQHPTKKNILVTPLGNIDINGDGFKSFFSYFQRNYTPQEKNNLTAIADRLIEDTDRRNNGDFWTPTLFVDYAHKMISEQLGEDWKDKYVVWDNCCGAKNLTRDYKFKELYCSTLFDSELKIGERYNKEAVSFQYDFLNDNLEKLPKGLIEAFEQNKPIVFFLNPPYAQNTGETKNIGTTESVCKTNIRNNMNNDNMGFATRNLYTQFIYRIIKIKESYNLSNFTFCIFCPTQFLTVPSFENFRNYLLNNFSFVHGVTFNAGHFDNVASSWGIGLTIWSSGKNINNNDFVFDVIDSDGENINIIRKKNIYNVDRSKTLNSFAKIKISDNDRIPNMPTLSSACKYVGDKSVYTNNGFGYLSSEANNVWKSGSFVSLFSMPVVSGHGITINETNFINALTIFATRKNIVCDWINCKDEFMIPNTTNNKWNDYSNDSIIYSIFHSGCHCSSLKIETKDIKNEFFWMSKSEIESLANEFSNDTCYSDVHTSEDRFVYKKLQEITLTPEAQAVLNKACDIVRKTFKYRELFNEEHPEYQINNWDCGWYQIKALAKEYAKDDFEEFKKLYKVLSDKMRPMVYVLGFLKINK